MADAAVLNKKKETDNVIIFVHIPKTGGSTLFFQFLLKKYSGELLIPWSTNLPIEAKKRIELIRGHFRYGVHKYLPQKNYTYITLLRNPIERIISTYYYIRQDPDIKQYRPDLYNILSQVTLNDYVTQEKYNSHKYIASTLVDKNWFSFSTVNFQTRILAGKDEDDLETAKNNLKKYFSIVGITERFDETLYVMQRELGLKIDSYKKEKQKATPNRPSIAEIPDKIIEIIKEKNQKDIELYQFANKLLDEKLEQLKK